MNIGIIGAGLSGATLARKLALANSGNEIVVYERNNFIGGQCYDIRTTDDMIIDYYFESKFGPHIFHTNDREVWNFVSNITDMKEYTHKVKTYINGDYIPYPINLVTMKYFFGKDKEDAEVRELVKKEMKEAKKKYTFGKTFEGNAKILVGETLYENIIKDYTKKMWGKDTSCISPDLCKRIPISFSRCDRFFRDTYQGLPTHGYTTFIEYMLKCRNIKVNLESKIDMDNVQKLIDKHDIVVSTADINDFFKVDSQSERLPYRKIKFEKVKNELKQKCSVVNFSDKSFKHFRSTDYKKMWRDQSCDTVICESVDEDNGEKLYPILTYSNCEISNVLINLLKDKKVYSLGRLGKYKYLNMDKAIREAIDFANFICTNAW